MIQCIEWISHACMRMCMQAKAAAGGGAKKKGLSVQKPAAPQAAAAAEPSKKIAGAAAVKLPAAQGKGKKAAKPAADEGAAKVKRAKSAYIFFCSDRRASVKGAIFLVHLTMHIVLLQHLYQLIAWSSASACHC